MAPELEAPGLGVRFTRDSDVFIALATRAGIANDWNADYFVSIHLNSDGPTGIETLYKTEKGKALVTSIQNSKIAVGLEVVSQTGLCKLFRRLVRGIKKAQSSSLCALEKVQSVIR